MKGTLAPLPDWVLKDEPPKPCDDHNDQAVQCEAAQPAPDKVYNAARNYLKKCDPAISGQAGHNQTFKIACKLVHGFKLSTDQALYLLETDYNPRCLPPWSHAELVHKVESALEKGHAEGMYANGHPHTTASSVKPGSATVQPKPHPTASGRRMKDISPKPVEWLWPGWIPLGKITMLDGDPGLGKSTMLLDLAARVSTHGIMPNNVQGISGNVIIMSAEDAEEDTIKPRLIAAGANEDRIYSLSHIKEDGEDRPIEIPKDLAAIEAKIVEWDARLLIIDPLMAFLFGADANKDQEIRRVLYKLSKIAERRRCANVLMRHLNKGGSTKAIYRGNSSIGVIGHARAGLLVAINPDNEHQRILAVTKCNLAAKPQSLTFVLDPVGDVCRIGWTGTISYHADQLVQAPPSDQEKAAKEEEKTKQEACQDLLQEILSTGPMEIKQAKKECNSASFSSRTTERAAKALGLVIAVVTNPDTGKKIYTWELPQS
jgi:hypothetical protein